MHKYYDSKRGQRLRLFFEGILKLFGYKPKLNLKIKSYPLSFKPFFLKKYPGDKNGM